MSRLAGPTGPSRAIAVALLLVLAISATVTWLRATAPVADTSAAAVPSAAVDPATQLRCVDLLAEDGTVVPAPGRATSGEVLACPVEFDRMTVTYIGEVVGDVLERDGGAWVLVNDDDYALVSGPLGASGVESGTNSGLSVWLPTPLHELVDEPGRAGRRGDVIEVVGIVRRADPDDGGGLTIRAQSATVLAEAVELEVPLHVEQLVVAVLLTALAIGLTVRDRRRPSR